MPRSQTAILTLSLFLVGCAVSTAPSGQSRGAAPPAIIPGVPFITWAEAARLEYRDKAILNPSFAASLGMILKYWGQDHLELLKRGGDEAVPTSPGGWGVTEARAAKGLDEVKSFVDRGIPVFVSPALTPTAHIPGPHVFGWAEIDPGLRRLIGEERGPRSGVLGRMLALDTFRRLEEGGRVTPWESVFVSSRVVIGYDDRQKVIILHDPSFGPAWQLGYDEFEKMWAAINRGYMAVYPPNYGDVLAKRSPASPYPVRTPDHQAAVHYVFGYALSSVGRVVDAEEQFRKGLAIPGIRNGYKHLLLFELALHQRTRGNTEEAIATAQKVIELLPQHHRPWEFLAQVYRSSFLPGWEQKAADAQRKAEALCSDSKAQNTVAKALAQEFFIFGCRGLLGPP